MVLELLGGVSNPVRQFQLLYCCWLICAMLLNVEHHQASRTRLAGRTRRLPHPPPLVASCRGEQHACSLRVRVARECARRTRCA